MKDESGARGKERSLRTSSLATKQAMHNDFCSIKVVHSAGRTSMVRLPGRSPRGKKNTIECR